MTWLRWSAAPGLGASDGGWQVIGPSLDGYDRPIKCDTAEGAIMLAWRLNCALSKGLREGVHEERRRQKQKRRSLESA